MIIKGVWLIDPASKTEAKADIVIKQDKIEKIFFYKNDEDSYNVEDEEMIIDGTDLCAAPGLVDVHVHFRDPGFEYKEDIYTGAKAAAAGGFTSVVMMANTKPAIDNVATLKYVIDKAATTDINVYSCADITVGLKGQNLTDMESLKEAGAVGFTDDGIPICDADLVKEAMIAAAKVNMPLSFHEENPEYISENGINAGIASNHYGIKGSPRIAEISMIERDIKIAEDLELDGLCPDIVIQHISTAEGVELVRKARETNSHIHAEACPHHFTLTEEAVIKHGSLAKMNPPLRTDVDREAIIRGLADGTIEIISTDHAPHSAEEKAKEITQAPSGIIGLETSFALGFRELVKRAGMDIKDLIAKMSTNPAKLYGLNAGRIYEGGPADLFLFTKEGEWAVSDRFESKSCNTPFAYEKMNGGLVVKTICAGKVVFEREY